MFPALNQLADSGWLAGDELKNFISRKGFLIFCTSLIGLEIFPSSDCTRRQVIHSLDFLVLLHQGKSTNEISVTEDHFLIVNRSTCHQNSFVE